MVDPACARFVLRKKGSRERKQKKKRLGELEVFEAYTSAVQAPGK